VSERRRRIGPISPSGGRVPTGGEGREFLASRRRKGYNRNFRGTYHFGRWKGDPSFLKCERRGKEMSFRGGKAIPPRKSPSLWGERKGLFEPEKLRSLSWGTGNFVTLVPKYPRGGRDGGGPSYFHYKGRGGGSRPSFSQQGGEGEVCLSFEEKKESQLLKGRSRFKGRTIKRGTSVKEK